MNEITSRLWLTLLARAGRSPDVPRLQMLEALQQAGISDGFDEALGELQRLGGLELLDGEEMRALSEGQLVRGNLVILGVDAPERSTSTFVRINSPSGILTQLTAKREMLGGDPGGPARLARDLGISTDVLANAAHEPIDESHWSYLKDMPLEFFSRAYVRAASRGDKEGMRQLVVSLARLHAIERSEIEAIRPQLSDDIAFVSKVAHAIEVQPPSSEGARRKPISVAVQREVWRRDQGRCVQCGSQERLEFDHIIPHSRGGADTVRNLQLLCEPCNRSKGADIGE